MRAQQDFLSGNLSCEHGMALCEPGEAFSETAGEESTDDVPENY